MKKVSAFGEKARKDAVDVLERGGVILYPTDTVYGLGADATNREAVGTIREIKGREATKTFLVMVSDLAMLSVYAEISTLARTLANVFLPGPLTLVLRAKGDALSPVLREDLSVGFRMPDNTIIRDLVREFGKPIVSTSANRTGMETAQCVDEILTELGEGAEKIELTLDAGPSKSNTPSTIVDARGERAIVLREGAVPRDLLVPFF